jgi:hypothetical protein
MSADKTLQDALTFDDMSGGPIIEKKTHFNHLQLTIAWSRKHALENKKLVLRLQEVDKEL